MIFSYFALCLAQSSLQIADFLVVVLLKLLLIGEVLLVGVFGLLELSLNLLYLIQTGLSLRLGRFELVLYLKQKLFS